MSPKQDLTKVSGSNILPGALEVEEAATRRTTGLAVPEPHELDFAEFDDLDGEDVQDTILGAERHPDTPQDVHERRDGPFEQLATSTALNKGADPPLVENMDNVMEKVVTDLAKSMKHQEENMDNVMEKVYNHEIRTAIKH